MKVRAIKFGFYHHKREPGDVFEFEGKPSEIWMEPVDAAALEAFKTAGFKVTPKSAEPPPAGTKRGPAGKKDGVSGAPKKPGSTGDQTVI
jgi:hypothetical protein